MSARTETVRAREGRVVHYKREAYDVYVGRPSRWGNPFYIGADGDRGEVIAKYETYLRGRADLMAQLPNLRGKVLACWCAPLPCHADVLVRLANELPPASEAVSASDATDENQRPTMRSDACFIAACDPETVLALVRVVEAAQAYRLAEAGCDVTGLWEPAREAAVALDAALEPFSRAAAGGALPPSVGEAEQ